jgi:ADP-ribose pyrophosphatase YjhB (NUDIX family)
MQPSLLFRHCPKCGAHRDDGGTANPFDCRTCGFRFYFNPAVAVAVFIRRDDGQILLIRRAKDPARGRLAPPGGFIDIGERAETAVGREIAEELGIRLLDVRFLCSQTNQYLFREVTYPVLDLFFTATTPDSGIRPDPEEVSAVEWHPISAVAVEDLAFPSMQAAWRNLEARFAEKEPDVHPGQSG